MEYTRKNRTASRNFFSKGPTASGESAIISNSTMESLMSGNASSASNLIGHREDLAASLNLKMSRAFGMDLSGVQVYRSDAMKDYGTEGLASGNKIVLSSDVNLNTREGQAVLGHEISHIHAQSKGIGMGHTGLYENAALEHQADTEGMMAARGLSFDGAYLGVAGTEGMSGISSLTPMGGGISASAGAPMQAKKEKKKNGIAEGDRSFKYSPYEVAGISALTYATRGAANHYDETHNKRETDTESKNDYVFNDYETNMLKKDPNDSFGKLLGHALSVPFRMAGKAIEKGAKKTILKPYRNKVARRADLDYRSATGSDDEEFNSDIENEQENALFKKDEDWNDIV